MLWVGWGVFWSYIYRERESWFFFPPKISSNFSPLSLNSLERVLIFKGWGWLFTPELCRLMWNHCCLAQGSWSLSLIELLAFKCFRIICYFLEHCRRLNNYDSYSMYVYIDIWISIKSNETWTCWVLSNSPKAIGGTNVRTGLKFICCSLVIPQLGRIQLSKLWGGDCSVSSHTIYLYCNIYVKIFRELDLFHVMTGRW